jgi:DMSO reductase family type II enzyme heme b subunit
MTAALSMRISILMAMVAMGSGCAKEPPAALSTAKPSPTPQLVEMGRQLYNKQCAVCHGPKGAGDGQAAYLLYPKPRDFTQNEFRLVSTNSMQATDEDLFLTITRGMPGSSMPSWEALSPEQRWALVYYVRQLTGVSEPIDPAANIPLPPETSKTPEGVARGRELFAQACASCHGPLGKGDGQQVMTDNTGFPVKPRDLTAGIFKGSSESNDLYYRIVAGLPGSPMPSYADVYTDEQLWDLIHYVQSLVPPGVEDRVRLHAQHIRVRRIKGEISSEPTAEVWRTAQPTFLALTPLWWRDQRVEGVEVKALHNGKELALQLSWNDPTRDSSTTAPQAFSDGAAAEFSLEQDPPFFGMGDANGVVQLWFWKASWQEDLKGWHDVENQYPQAAVDWYPAQRDYQHGEHFEVSQSPTAAHDPGFMGGWGAENPLSNPHRTSAAEEAMAKGLGTLTSRPPAMQRVQANGVWQSGRWQVVLHRPLAPNEETGLKLKPGQEVSVAFAIWDGHAHDRNGQKSVSIWNRLSLER